MTWQERDEQIKKLSKGINVRIYDAVNVLSQLVDNQKDLVLEEPTDENIVILQTLEMAYYHLMLAQ